MTEKELMAILNDPSKNVACFVPGKPHEVSREEFKAWLKRRAVKPKRKTSAKKKGCAK